MEVKYNPLRGDKNQAGRPFFVPAGLNKYGHAKCPFCKTEGVMLKPEDFEGKAPFHGFAFFFSDILSVREYRISGLCQDCQDATFGQEPN